jgi:ribosome modulation factor
MSSETWSMLGRLFVFHAIFGGIAVLAYFDGKERVELAHQQGVEAARLGHSDATCPPWSDHLRQAWLAGWREAKANQ